RFECTSGRSHQSDCRRYARCARPIRRPSFEIDRTRRFFCQSPGLKTILCLLQRSYRSESRKDWSRRRTRCSRASGSRKKGTRSGPKSPSGGYGQFIESSITCLEFNKSKQKVILYMNYVRFAALLESVLLFGCAP